MCAATEAESIGRAVGGGRDSAGNPSDNALTLHRWETRLLFTPAQSLRQTFWVEGCQ